MKNLSSLLFITLAPSVGLAATVNISDLSELGTPDETVTAIGAFGTFNNRTVNSVANVDTKDATFALLVDFNDPASVSTDNHLLWETGAGTIGMSLVYSPASSTVSLRQASSSGSIVLQVDQVLSAFHLSEGDLEIIWTFDTDGGAGGGPQIELYVDSVSAGTDSNSSSQADWSGGDPGGFGASAGNVAANGSNGPLPSIVDFADGTINTGTGVRFWADTHAVIPEPGTALLSLIGLGFALTRRRH
ncbi:MAG: PEP-CTERM sorting domain-containing protein [Akkermansiaceae bacterium]|jgi:hypothetical protein|nr:PEP-CTERM sorting domain-containing protein [Akkermansiaceae bacterium]